MAKKFKPGKAGKAGKAPVLISRPAVAPPSAVKQFNNAREAMARSPRPPVPQQHRPAPKPKKESSGCMGCGGKKKKAGSFGGSLGPRPVANFAAGHGRPSAGANPNQLPYHPTPNQSDKLYLHLPTITRVPIDPPAPPPKDPKYNLRPGNSTSPRPVKQGPPTPRLNPHPTPQGLRRNGNTAIQPLAFQATHGPAGHVDVPVRSHYVNQPRITHQAPQRQGSMAAQVVSASDSSAFSPVSPMSDVFDLADHLAVRRGGSSRPGPSRPSSARPDSTISEVGATLFYPGSNKKKFPLTVVGRMDTVKRPINFSGAPTSKMAKDATARLQYVPPHEGATPNIFQSVNHLMHRAAFKDGTPKDLYVAAHNIRYDITNSPQHNAPILQNLFTALGNFQNQFQRDLSAYPNSSQYFGVILHIVRLVNGQ